MGCFKDFIVVLILVLVKLFLVRVYLFLVCALFLKLNKKNMKFFFYLLLFVAGKSLNAQEFNAEINFSPSSILCGDELFLNGNYDGDTSYVKRWIVKDYGEVIDSRELEYGYSRIIDGSTTFLNIIYEVARKSDGVIKRDSVYKEVEFEEKPATHVTLTYGTSILWGEFLDFSNISHISLGGDPFGLDGEYYYSSDYFDFDSFGVGKHTFDIVTQCNLDSLYVTVLDTSIITNTAFNNLEDSDRIEEFNKTIYLEAYQNQEGLFVSINSEVSQKEEVLIFDLEGRRVYSAPIEIIDGSSNLTIPIGHFSDGIYVIRVRNKALQFPIVRQ